MKVANILPDHRTLRFRTFITLGMWLISTRDRLFVRIASSSETDRGTPITVESSYGRSLQAVVHKATSPQAGILILHGIGDRPSAFPASQRNTGHCRDSGLESPHGTY